MVKEYKTVFICDPLAEALTKFSKEGWDFVTFIPDSSILVLLVRTKRTMSDGEREVNLKRGY